MTTLKHSVSALSAWRRVAWAWLLALSSLLPSASAQVPNFISYQGKISVSGVPFNGTGSFKFALLDQSDATLWSNDGTSVNGSEPAAAVQLAVGGGLYSVLLGQTTLPNMTVAIPYAAFSGSNVKLRVWFNDGANGSQRLTPDQRLAPSGYAMIAATVPDGSIGAAQIASGAVTSSALAANSVTSAAIASGAVGTTQIAAGAVTGPKIANGAVGTTQLAAGAVLSNLNASGQSGVTSGGMLLSGEPNSSSLAAAGYVRLGAVNLGSEAWTKRKGGEPAGVDPRRLAVSVWTGTEMLIWGGFGSFGSDRLNTGLAYHPATDVLRQLSVTNAPTARAGATAVWSGTEMLVWGGRDTTGMVGTGGRYDPVADTWSVISNLSAPARRERHVAVWTGSEMIVWGGNYNDAGGSQVHRGGGRYSPTTGLWTTVPDNAASLSSAVAVWTGTEMLAWGGSTGLDPYSFATTGYRYNPSNDSWNALSTAGAPAPRFGHTGVWTGTELLVWGGSTGTQPSSNGGAYQPTTDSWTTLSNVGVPQSRQGHAAVWTGSEMLVFGGSNRTDLGRYARGTDSWTTQTLTSPVANRDEFAYVWTGTDLLISGGKSNSAFVNDFARYRPSNSSWTALTPVVSSGPAVRELHTAVWTGAELLVWGGLDGTTYYDNGKRYNPVVDNWSVIRNSGAPVARAYHSAVWTGSKMLIWGGENAGGRLANGGAYDPVANTWTAISTSGAPAARREHTAVWTGDRMLVWGGRDGTLRLNTGARYNPSNDNWIAITTTGAPAARVGHSAIWTGSNMIVWGGRDGGTFYGNGAVYDLDNNAWQNLTNTGAPSARANHTAAWTGAKMLVWGGDNGAALATGAAYDVATGSWSALNGTNAPSARRNVPAVWTGTDLIVWGGDDLSVSLATGAIYNPGVDTWTTITSTNAAPARTNFTATFTGAQMLVFGGSSGGVRLADLYSYSPVRQLYLYSRP